MAEDITDTIKIVSTKEMSSDTRNIDDKVKNRFNFVINYFQKNNPSPTTELIYKNPFELLVAVILSARTTDKRVNMITPKLFEMFPTPDKLAKATPNEIYQYISSVSFPNNKSVYLVEMAKMLVNKYGGNVPEDENGLIKLPGVGIKTASVVASTIFNRPTIAVDTHVLRVSDRIGLTTDATTPKQSGEQLMAYTPKDVRSKMSHWLILHGRYICTARGPKCDTCGIKEVCRHYEVNYQE